MFKPQSANLAVHAGQNLIEPLISTQFEQEQPHQMPFPAHAETHLSSVRGSK